MEFSTDNNVNTGTWNLDILSYYAVWESLKRWNPKINTLESKRTQQEHTNSALELCGIESASVSMSSLLVLQKTLLYNHMSCLLLRKRRNPAPPPRTRHPPDDHLYIKEWRNATRRFWSRLNSFGICRVGQSLKGLIQQTSGRMWMGKDQLMNVAWRFRCLLFKSKYLGGLS